MIKTIYICRAGLHMRYSERIHVDSRGSRYLPSWSWVGWSGSIDYHQTVPFDGVWAVWLDDLSDDFTEIVSESHGKPITIDAANIMVYLAVNAPTDFTPTLISIERPLRVMLHLWVNTCRCDLIVIPSTSGQDTPRWLYQPTIWCSKKENLVTLDSDDLVPKSCELDLSLEYELMWVDARKDQFIMICHGAFFAERIGILQARKSSSKCQGCPIGVGKYVRLR